MKRWLATLLLTLTFSPAAQAEPLKVVTSFSILGNLVQQVGGEQVSVRTLVGPGMDAHVFQPKPSDVRAVKEAQVLVINGLGFEGWMERLTNSSGFKGTLITATDGLKNVLMRNAEEEDREGQEEEPGRHDDHHGHGVNDPHAWQNVANVRLYVRNIRAGLTKADPAHAEAYAARAAKVDHELAALDAWVKDQWRTVPEKARVVITSHDAFGYYGDAYRVTFLAPQGYNTEAEPTAADVSELIAQIKDKTVKALFIETMANPRVVKQLANETGAKVGGGLFSDALSDTDGPAASYQAMVKHNTSELVNALKTD